MGELTFEIGQNAYIKLVLHALKHKSSAVNGVLVGRYDAGKGIVQISDAVPLFHSNTALLPSLEIALMQIEAHYASQDVSLVGYFHANERSDDYDLSNVAKNIGDHLCRYFPQAGILLLDNQKLEALPKVRPKPRDAVIFKRWIQMEGKREQPASNEGTISEHDIVGLCINSENGRHY
ncbi:unnamed protein product [Amaranthus hypochondriacus]